MDNFPILKNRKYKNKHLFDDIQEWFTYYKRDILNLYYYFLDECHINGINMLENKKLYNEFIILVFNNSYKLKI